MNDRLPRVCLEAAARSRQNPAYQATPAPRFPMQEPVIKYIEACEDDLAAASVLMNNDHNFYIPFLCQQALEKMLRGYFLETQNRYPPLTHDLLILADYTDAGQRLDEETRAFIASLSIYPEVVGNPVYRAKIREQATPESAAEMLSRTREIVETIRSLF